MTSAEETIAYFAHQKQGSAYLGALVVVSFEGDPVDFAYTDPVTLNRFSAQLLGARADGYMISRVLLEPLLKQVKAPGLVCFDEPQVLLRRPVGGAAERRVRAGGRGAQGGIVVLPEAGNGSRAPRGVLGLARGRRFGRGPAAEGGRGHGPVRPARALSPAPRRDGRAGRRPRSRLLVSPLARLAARPQAAAPLEDGGPPAPRGDRPRRGLAPGVAPAGGAAHPAGPRPVAGREGRAILVCRRAGRGSGALGLATRDRLRPASRPRPWRSARGRRPAVRTAPAAALGLRAPRALRRVFARPLGPPFLEDRSPESDLLFLLSSATMGAAARAERALVAHGSRARRAGWWPGSATWPSAALRSTGSGAIGLRGCASAAPGA